MNEFRFIGRVGKDPEVRELDGGNTVANFSIATTERWKDKKGEKQERTEWHDCVLWGKLAELAEKYVEKGDMLFVGGSIRHESYEKDGITRYTVKFQVDKMEFLTPKGNKEEREEKPKSSGRDKKRTPAPDNETDDLPF